MPETSYHVPPTRAQDSVKNLARRRGCGRFSPSRVGTDSIFLGETRLGSWAGKGERYKNKARELNSHLCSLSSPAPVVGRRTPSRPPPPPTHTHARTWLLASDGAAVAGASIIVRVKIFSRGDYLGWSKVFCVEYTFEWMRWWGRADYQMGLASEWGRVASSPPSPHHLTLTAQVCASISHHHCPSEPVPTPPPPPPPPPPRHLAMTATAAGISARLDPSALIRR